MKSSETRMLMVDFLSCGHTITHMPPAFKAILGTSEVSPVGVSGALLNQAEQDLYELSHCGEGGD